MRPCRLTKPIESNGPHIRSGQTRLRRLALDRHGVRRPVRNLLFALIAALALFAGIMSVNPSAQADIVPGLADTASI